jgi:dimethylargininase
MHFTAITRKVSPGIEKCELTHLSRLPIDYSKAVAQHDRYEALLKEMGGHVESLPADSDFPDCVFVEDTAIVLPDVAVMTFPGAVSRQNEVSFMANALRKHRPLEFLKAPATLDGGDVLLFNRVFYIGVGLRTNEEGIRQLEQIVKKHDYRVKAIPMRECLHLKTAITAVDEDTLLFNPRWIETKEFSAKRWIECDPTEPFGANALLIGKEVVYPSAHSRTLERLNQHGIKPRTTDVSELAKAEAGVTCCSLIF